MTNIIYENLKNEMATMDISIGDISATMDIKEEQLRKLLSGEEPLGQLTAHNIATRVFATNNIAYLFEHESDHDKLKSLIHNLDNEMGAMSINLKDLEAINTEMGRVMEVVNETDRSEPINMAIVFRDIESKLRMIDSLLNYSFKDLSKNFEESYDLKTKLFDGIVRGGNEDE